MNRRRAWGIALLAGVLGSGAAVFWLIATTFANLITALFGSLFTISVLLFGLALQNLDRTAGVMAWIYSGLSGVASVFERNAVANRIKSSIGAGARAINSEGGTPVLPHGVKVVWVKPKEVELDSFIKKGEVVVVLEHHMNDGRNLARATTLFVSGGLIPSSRAYVDPTLMKAADFAVAKRILTINSRLDAVECLNKEFVLPEIKVNPAVGGFLSSIEEMDEDGTFSRILMREFSAIWAKLFPLPPSQVTFKETVAFSKMIGKLATRQVGERVALDFRGRTISTSLIPVARDQLVGAMDISGHLTAARIAKANGFETIYVLARGKVNVPLAEIAVKGIVGEDLYILENEFHFHGLGKDRFNAYIAAMRIKRLGTQTHPKTSDN